MQPLSPSHGYQGGTSPPPTWSPPNNLQGNLQPSHQYSAQYNQGARLSSADASDWKHTTDRISTFVEKGSQDETQVPSKTGEFCFFKHQNTLSVGVGGFDPQTTREARSTLMESSKKGSNPPFQN